MNAVMYGAGNIGRGFIGELFYRSGYRIAFIDVNLEIINALNEKGKYTVEAVSNDGSREIEVSGVSGVNGMDAAAVSGAIAKADIMATAVGVNILPRIAGNIAQGLKTRFDGGNFSYFNIIICENMIDADKFLREAVKEKIGDDYKDKVDELVGFVEASIGRMVPIQTPALTNNDILRVCVEPFNTLYTDKNGFRGAVPEIVSMEACAPFDLYIKRKLYIHNMGHSMTAYLGSLKGYEYIWQAIEDPEIEVLVFKAMLSVAAALSKAYDADLQKIISHVEDLVYRFGNRKLGDTAFRVGRDIPRKLSPEDRLIGAIKLCREVDDNPAYLYAAVAAALGFAKNELPDFSADRVMTDISKLDKSSEEFKRILEFKELIDKKDLTGVNLLAKKLKNG